MDAGTWSSLISLAVAITVLAAGYFQWWDIGYRGKMPMRRWVKRLFAILIAALVVAAGLVVIDAL